MNYLQYRGTTTVFRYSWKRRIFQLFDVSLGRWTDSETLEDSIHGGNVRESYEAISKQAAENLIGRTITDD